MKDIKNNCFVCKKEIEPKIAIINMAVNLPFCDDCSDTNKEKETAEEYLDSLTDGLACGCI